MKLMIRTRREICIIHFPPLSKGSMGREEGGGGLVGGFYLRGLITGLEKRPPRDY